jgi:hypothetical protein
MLRAEGPKDPKINLEKSIVLGSFGPSALSMPGMGNQKKFRTLQSFVTPEGSRNSQLCFYHYYSPPS